jgi:hypothetical protein
MTVSETMQFTIGSEVSCSDGVCGELSRVVVDPIAQVLTHLVVKPDHRWRPGHLVPIDLVESAGEQIRLRCTRGQFEALDEAEVTHFLTGASGQWDYEQEEMLSMPYYSLVMSGVGGVTSVGMGMGPEAVTYDRVPVGEVEVHRGDHVHSTDGPIGRVRGLVIDPSAHHVTHVLLDEGHLWGQKEVAIPISAVTGFDDGVRLNLTRDEVRDLPPVHIEHR